MQLQNSHMSFQTSNLFKKTGINFTPQNADFINSSTRRRRMFSIRRFSTSASISLDDIAQVFHNKVLVAATVSAAIGQLTKPITNSVFYGKNFDLKATIQAGGFPSTHSSAVVATATSLAIDRGFSDAIFGLAVVYAGLIMYDAQGVRREVGTHAKELNKVLLRTKSTSTSTSSRNDANNVPNSFSRESSPTLNNTDSLFLEEQNSNQTKSTISSVLLKSDNRSVSTSFGVESDIKSEQEHVAYGLSPLKESIGHTEIEVAAGALLGFIVSLAICPYL